MSAQPTPPAFLNYITGDKFRQLLEDDYREMTRALESGCWKSAQVVAGSMIEAILIDYLRSKNTDPTKDNQILKLDLSQAIDECKTAGILSEKTASLCAVIRQYRNLIHPGRIVRLDQSVIESDARVAGLLIQMVADDIAKKQKEVYGYTAEQVVAKIHKDSTAFGGILKSLTSSLRDREKKRLLSLLLPQENGVVRRSLEKLDPWEDHEQRAEFERQRACIKTCFAVVHKAASPELRQELIQEYIEILHQATQVERQDYEDAFFSAELIRNATAQQREVILDHYFTALGRGCGREFLTNVQDITALFVRGAVTTRWLRQLYNSYFANHQMTDVEFQSWFKKQVFRLPREVAKELKDVAGFHLAMAQEKGASDETVGKAREVISLATDSMDADIPF